MHDELTHPALVVLDPAQLLVLIRERAQCLAELVGRAPRPDERLDPQQQLGPVEWFRQQVVAARLERRYGRLAIAERGQEQHRRLRHPRRRADPPAGLEPAEPRHEHVEHDQIHALPGESLERLLAAGHRDHLVARRLEVSGRDQPVLRRVVDHEHAIRGAHGRTPVRVSTSTQNVRTSIGLLM